MRWKYVLVTLSLSVSYTHLDVYKRQAVFTVQCHILDTSAPTVVVSSITLVHEWVLYPLDWRHTPIVVTIVSSPEPTLSCHNWKIRRFVSYKWVQHRKRELAVLYHIVRRKQNFNIDFCKWKVSEGSKKKVEDSIV